MAPPKKERNVRNLRTEDAVVEDRSPEEPATSPEKRSAKLLQIFDDYYNQSDKSVKMAWKILDIIKGKFRGLLPPGRDVGIQGRVPGVDVGQIFHFRAQLALVGLHRPSQAGIDWKKVGRISMRDPGTPTYISYPVGLSVVVSGGYEDNVDEGETLYYTGEGGHQSGSRKHVENQKLKRGNKALANNIFLDKPVRVIRAHGRRTAADQYYSFDGLYKVESIHAVRGKSEFSVFKFKLVREPGQRPLLWRQVNVAT